MRRLEGRVALITGGAGGIGSASVRRFVSEGARVAIADVDTDRAQALADELGTAARPMFFDAANEESIAAALAETVEHFGRLDILFNNAAYTGPGIDLDTDVTGIPLEVWDETVTVNQRGVMLGCRHAIPHMLKSGGGGSIINTASDAGLAGDIARVAYGTTKAAIIGLGMYVATQYGKQGIRCNTIAPGAILTPANRDRYPEFMQLLEKHVLTPRLGEPSDIAALAAFLASDESAYITGQTICCDGGHLAHQPQIADVRQAQESTAGR